MVAGNFFYVFLVADVLSTDPTKLVPALLGPLMVMDAKFLVLAACHSSLLGFFLLFLVPSCILLFLVPSPMCRVISVVTVVLYLNLIYNENGSGWRKPAVARSKNKVINKMFSSDSSSRRTLKMIKTSECRWMWLSRRSSQSCVLPYVGCSQVGFAVYG